ncbi:protein HEATR9 isoform X2 [Macrotis lagotis]|uniref:protein HEATR9 isoform X2 n=1 Tax=Macrotis lagotis TaxID=92651 RepID=UPI003D68F0EB
MKQFLRPSTTIPELAPKSQEDVENGKVPKCSTSRYSKRTPFCYQAHQLVSTVFPPSPFIWRKSTPRDPEKSSHVKTFSDIFTISEMKMPHKDWKSANTRQHRVKLKPLVDHHVDFLKRQRLKDLTLSLSSPVEDEQVYAAQALGKLRISTKFIIEALWVSVSRRTGSALDRCLHKHVVLSLIEQLKKCSISRRMDTLSGLHIALNVWILLPKSKREPIGAKDALKKVLKMLVKGKSPQDNVALEAALCLSLLDPENLIAREFLLQCLTQGEMKKKIKALMALVKLMRLHSLPILQAIMEQLQSSFVVKHRLEALKLLKTIGLVKIQNLGMEKDIFELLKLKLHEDPFQEVKTAVAEIVEVLKMKPMMMNVVESELNDASASKRRQAVISIGVLGISSSRMFYFLMDMLDYETDELVRKELEEIFIILSKKDPWIREKLQDWTLLVEEEARQQKERAEALNREKMRRDLKENFRLLGELGSIFPEKMSRGKKVIAKKENSIFGVPIKGIALASHYPPCIKTFAKKEQSLPKGSWDSPAIREHLKNLASL